MGDAYAGPRDGVFSRPYEPRLLGLPREQQQSMRRLSGEAGTAAARQTCAQHSFCEDLKKKKTLKENGTHESRHQQQ